MAYQASEILRGFWNDPDRRRRRRLAELWSSWKDIVGDDIAELAKPLGHKNSTLLLGVEDPMAMQELHFQGPMILDAVNTSLGEIFFDKVRLDLLSGRSSLDALASTLTEGRIGRPQSSLQAFENAGIKVEELGRNVDKFSSLPALERCYRAYVRFLEGAKAQNNNDQ